MSGQVKIDVSGLENVKKKLFSRLANRQTEKLLEYAPLMLKNSFNQKTFKSRTWNLADSYVWVVYYNGEVKGSGYLWNSRFASKDADFHHTKINGRNLAQSFINTYNSQVLRGWEVVWAATAPYATYLENGVKSRRFKVISSIYDEIVSDFNGKARVQYKTT